MTLSQQLILDGIISSVPELFFLGLKTVAFGWCILQMKFHKSKFRLIVGLLLVITSGVIEGYWKSMGSIRLHLLFLDYGFEWPNKYLIDILSLIIQIVFFTGLIIVFNEKVIKGILKLLFCMLSDGIIYIPVEKFIIGGIVKILNLQLTDVVYSVINTILYMMILFIISYFLKKRKELVQCIQDIPAMYYIICIISYSFCMEIPRYFLNQYYSLEYSVRSAFLKFGVYAADILYALIVVLVFINFWFKHYKKENYLKNQHLQILREYYNGVSGYIKEVRSIKHDMKAHMNVLESYLNTDNFEQAKKYLCEIKVHQSYGNARIINVGNELVNAVLTEVMQRTENEDIILVCEGALPSNLPIADFDLCTIFSNVITNATEACNALKEKEKRIILRMKVLQKNIVIVCENPIEAEVDTSTLKGYTSKKDKRSHGYGLFNIEKTIAKYGGEMKLSVEDEKFQLAILLYQIIGEE